MCLLHITFAWLLITRRKETRCSKNFLLAKVVMPLQLQLLWPVQKLEIPEDVRTGWNTDRESNKFKSNNCEDWSQMKFDSSMILRNKSRKVRTLHLSPKPLRLMKVYYIDHLTRLLTIHDMLAFSLEQIIPNFILLETQATSLLHYDYLGTGNVAGQASLDSTRLVGLLFTPTCMWRLEHNCWPAIPHLHAIQTARLCLDTHQ